MTDINELFEHVTGKQFFEEFTISLHAEDESQSPQNICLDNYNI